MLNDLLDILIIFLTFNAIIYLLTSIRNNFFSSFESFSLLILLIISTYAVWRTFGLSIYSFSLLTIGIYFFKFRKEFYFKKLNWNYFIYSNLIWLIFSLIYFIIPGLDFGYPHEDYIIYGRIAYYNDLFGVENTQTFYNLISNPNKLEIYHYAELWLSTFIKKINGVSFIPNLILISYPLMGFVLFLGIHEIFKIEGIFKSFLITLLILLVFNPYDEILRYFDIGLPLVGFSSLMFNLKTLFILPPIILSIKGIVNRNPNYQLIAIFSLFYPLIIPVLFIGLALYEFFKGKRELNNFFIIFAFLGLFGIFSTYFQISGTEISFKYFFDLGILSKMMWIVLFVPGLLLIIPIYFSYKFFKKTFIHLLIFSFFVFVSGAFFYVLLYENIDSNQMFRNISSTLYSILLGFGIFYSFKINLKIGYTLIFFYCFPILYNIFLPKSVKGSDEMNSLNRSLLPYTTLVFVPDKDYVNSVYQYNERLNLQILDLFLLREDINLVNIASGFPISSKINNSVSVSMVASYKSISPFCYFCSNWKMEDLNCVIEFAKSINSDGILIKGSNALLDQYNFKVLSDDFYLMTF